MNKDQRRFTCPARQNLALMLMTAHRWNMARPLFFCWICCTMTALMLSTRQYDLNPNPHGFSIITFYRYQQESAFLWFLGSSSSPPPRGRIYKCRWYLDTTGMFSFQLKLKGTLKQRCRGQRWSRSSCWLHTFVWQWNHWPVFRLAIQQNSCFKVSGRKHRL